MLNHFACVGLKRHFFNIWYLSASSTAIFCVPLLKNARVCVLDLTTNCVLIHTFCTNPILILYIAHASITTFFKLLVTTFVVIVTIITASILILRAQNFRWDSIIFLECRLIDKNYRTKMMQLQIFHYPNSCRFNIEQL